ncbi:MAG: metallophosphoesterase family protein [Anaerolineales bacterium]
MESADKNNRGYLVGVIADTHGLVRLPALEVLEGSDLILHAGDVGKLEVLDALRAVAPVQAVRGNMDRGPWAQTLPLARIIEIGRIRIYLLHDLGQLDLDPAATGFDVVISGHSHRSYTNHENGVTFLNPGSAGPHRFNFPVSVARLYIQGDSIQAEIVPIDV